MLKLNYVNNGKSHGREFFLNVDRDEVRRITDLGNRRGILLKSGEHYSVSQSLEEIFNYLNENNSCNSLKI